MLPVAMPVVTIQQAHLRMPVRPTRLVVVQNNQMTVHVDGPSGGTGSGALITPTATDAAVVYVGNPWYMDGSPK